MVKMGRKPKPENDRKVQVSVMMSKEMFDRVEKNRGLINRSVYLEDKLKKVIFPS